MPKKVKGKIKESARSFLPKIKGRFPIARLPDHCLCGQTFVKKYFRKGKFDFVDVDSDRNPKTSAPDSYEGMSGGGLWKITVGRKKEEDAGIIRVLGVTLAGVVFYQSKEVKLRRIVRCHGPKTIYQNLLAKLKKEFSV
jgi:hypothetical protein